MAGRKGSFATLVRETLQRMSPATVDNLTMDISTTASTDVVAGRHVRPMVQTALRDLCKSGEAERIDSATYRWLGRSGETPQIRERMWRVIRARRTVSVEDLMELAEAGEHYAMQWLRLLVRQGIMRKLSDGRFQMIHDPVIMPEDEEKKQNLRALYKKRVRKALERAEAAIAEAREALDDA